MPSVASITNKLEAALQDITHIDVKDTSSGCGSNFEVVIVSPSFTGKPTLARHRTVNDILKEELKDIHAFAQKTYTPEEWEKKAGSKDV